MSEHICPKCRKLYNLKVKGNLLHQERTLLIITRFFECESCGCQWKSTIKRR